MWSTTCLQRPWKDSRLRGLIAYGDSASKAVSILVATAELTAERIMYGLCVFLGEVRLVGRGWADRLKRTSARGGLEGGVRERSAREGGADKGTALRGAAGGVRGTSVGWCWTVSGRFGLGGVRVMAASIEFGKEADVGVFAIAVSVPNSRAV